METPLHLVTTILLAEQLGTQVGLAISNTLVRRTLHQMAHSVRKMQMLRDQMQQLQETLHDGKTQLQFA